MKETFLQQENPYIKPATKRDISTIIKDHSLSFPFSNYLFVDTLWNLTEKLYPFSRSYDTLISDDASGRLVTLFLREVFKQENPTLSTYFVAGGRPNVFDPHDPLQDFSLFLQNKHDIGKTLLVTEYINSGGSIQRLIEIFDKHHVSMNIATVSMIKPKTSYKNNLFSTHDVFYGSIGTEGLYSWDMPERTGVDRLHTTSFYPQKSKEAHRELMEKTRRSGKILAHIIYQAISQ